MTKIEEILEKYRNYTDHYADQEWDDGGVEKALIEYAEWYAKKVLELAAEKCRISVNEGTGARYVTSYEFKEHGILHECFIDQRTITNIQLPAHE